MNVKEEKEKLKIRKMIRYLEKSKPVIIKVPYGTTDTYIDAVNMLISEFNKAYDRNIAFKDEIRKQVKNIEKRMETATNSTEYQKLHCAQEYLRGLLWEV